jgi:hypothetical protein
MQSGLALPCYAREGELPPSPALHPQNQQQRKNQEQQQNQNQNQNQEQQQNQGRLHRRLDTPRDYLSAVLPGLADTPLKRLPALTPTAWASQRQ